MSAMVKTVVMTASLLIGAMGIANSATVADDTTAPAAASMPAKKHHKKHHHHRHHHKKHHAKANANANASANAANPSS